MRPLVVVLLFVCLQGAGIPGVQGSALQEFPRSAWTAIAQGQLDLAESLARTQPAGDAEAAGVLGHLAIRSGRYDEAVKLLEPAAASVPLSRAALELGLLHQRLGRSEAAGQILSTIFRQGAAASDPYVLARAAGRG